MDPNATLADIRSRAVKIANAVNKPDVIDELFSIEADASELAGSIADLVEWLQHGGYAPDA